MEFQCEFYEREKSAGQSLAVIQCGLSICDSGHICQSFYPDYSVHFILDGKGVYSVNGKDYELGKGQGFLITPNTSNIYVADKKEPWKYIYATFKGIDADALVRSAGLDSSNVIFSFSPDEEMIYLLNCMHKTAKDNSAKGYDTLGCFLFIMSRIIREYSQKEPQLLSSEQYIRLALSYIDDRLCYDISVREIADYIGICRVHLYRIFKKHLGVSPSDYLCDIRLKRTVELMENPELTISEIALSSGFYDLSHFSKSFQAKYGVSPGKYRKNIYRI